MTIENLLIETFSDEKLIDTTKSSDFAGQIETSFGVTIRSPENLEAPTLISHRNSGPDFIEALNIAFIRLGTRRGKLIEPNYGHFRIELRSSSNPDICYRISGDNKNNTQFKKS